MIKINGLNFNRLFNLLFTILAIGGLIYLSLLFVSTHALGLVYNSDIISIPYLYRDLLYQGGSISQWTFPPTPAFFPDLLVYAVLSSVIGNLKTSIGIFAIYQFLLYYVLIVYLGKRVIKKENSGALFNVSVFLTFFFYASGYLQQNIFYAPASAGHFGTACMFLAGIILILNTFENKTKINYVLLALLCMFTLISDILFITQFIATAVASLLVMSFILEKAKARIAVTNIIVIISSSILGYIVYHNSKFLFNIHIAYYHHPIKRITFNEILLASQTIFHKLGLFYQNNAFILLLVFCFFTIALVFLVNTVYLRVKGQLLKENELPYMLTLLMLFLSIFTGYFSLATTDNNLLSSDPSLRHYQTFILFPVFLGIPLLIAKLSNVGELVSNYYKSIVIAILACAFTFSSSGTAKTLFAYYPSQVACIDNYAKEYHLQNGVAQYWNAKIYSFLSKNEVNIATINLIENHLVPSFGFNTKNNYLNKSFNFVLIDNSPDDFLSEKLVRQHYGTPIKSLTCPSDQNEVLTLYLYKPGIIDQGWKNLT